MALFYSLIRYIFNGHFMFKEEHQLNYLNKLCLGIKNKEME